MLFGRGVTRVVQFVAFLILARSLSPAAFGWFGVLTTAIALAATLGNLGLRQSFAYEIGQQRLTPGQAAGTSLVLWPVLSLVSAAIIFVIYGERIEGLAPNLAALIIFLGVAGAILLSLFQGIFLGKGAIWAFSLSEALPRVLFVIGVVVLALTARVTLVNALWLQVGTFVVALPAIAFFALWGSGKLGTVLRRLRPMLNYGLIFAFNLFLVTLSSRLSLLVIESSLGASAAGQFFAAVRVHEIFLEVASALGMVLFANAVRSNDQASAINRGVRAASLLFWFFMVIAVVVILLAPLILTLLLGDSYADAAPVLQILALGLAPTAAAKMLYPSIAGAGHPYFGTPVIFVSLVMNGALALLLVPAVGVAGGAIALVIGQYVLLLGYAITSRARFGIPLHHLIVPRLSDVKSLKLNALTRRKRKGTGDPRAGAEIHDGE